MVEGRRATGPGDKVTEVVLLFEAGGAQSKDSLASEPFKVRALADDRVALEETRGRFDGAGASGPIDSPDEDPSPSTPPSVSLSLGVSSKLLVGLGADGCLRLPMRVDGMV